MRATAAALARGLDRLSSLMNRIALWGAVLAVLTMVLAAGWQVVARYIFAAPPIWTEELARRAMVWAGMLGASAAFRAGADPSLFPDMVAIRGRLGAGLALVRAAGAALFVLPVLWFSIYGPGMNVARGFLGRNWERTAEMIPVSMVWFVAAVPVGFGLILLHLTAQLAMRLTAQAEPPTQGLSA